MANNSIALRTEGPDFANSFNKGQEAAQGRQLNSLRIQGVQQEMANQQEEKGRTQALQLMEAMGSAGMYALGGDINGTPDPAKWAEALDGLTQMGLADAAKYKDRPGLASVVVSGSLKASDRIKMAQDDREFNQSLAEFQLEIDKASSDANKPQSTLGKLATDRDRGIITPEDYNAAKAKATAPSRRPLTDGQAKTAGYAKRMIESEGILSTAPEGDQAIIDKADPGKASVNPLSGDFWESMNRKHGPNMTQSPEYQKFVNGAQEWVRAKLRKESGAAISDSEWASEFKTYFPQPGDGAEVIKQKATLRATAIESMRAESRGGYEALFEGGDTGADTVSSDELEPNSRVIDGVTYEQDEAGEWFEVE